MTKQAMGQRKFLLIKARTNIMPFGKHKGKSVEWLLEHDPGYLVWLDDEKIAKVDDELYQLAQQYEYESQEDWGSMNMCDWMDEPF